MIAKLLIVTFGTVASLFIATYNLTTSCEPVSGQAELIEHARVAYEERLREWRQYIQVNEIYRSSLAEKYISNIPFRRLLETGPVMIPWLINEPPSAFLHTAIHLLLRSDWVDLAEDKDKEIMRLNVYDEFRAWWKLVPYNAPLWYADRLRELHVWISEQARPLGFADVRISNQWKKLRNVGILGLPSAIERIKMGAADEYDYRLVLFWTDPIEYDKNGLPKLPQEREDVNGEIGTAKYWIAWWEANGWQYWWLKSVRN